MRDELPTQELERLLSESYNKAEKKKAFLEQVAAKSEALMHHAEKSFCEGYARCLNDLGTHARVISFKFLTTTYAYVIQNDDKFREALVVEERKHLPTPQKVLVKMLVERMHMVIKFVNGKNEAELRYNANPQIQSIPTLNCKAALASWVASDHCPSYGRFNKTLKLVLKRDDIPDSVYQEAWDVAQVREVMDS